MNAFMNRVCPEDEMLVKLMMGELPVDNRRDLLSHISSCPKCRLKFETLAEIETQLQARGDPFPKAVLSAGEAAQLKTWAQKQARALPNKRDVHPASRPWLRAVAAAAALLIIAAGSLLLFRHQASGPILRSGSGSELRLLLPAEKLKGPPEVFLWTEIEGTERYGFTLIDNELNVLYETKTQEAQVRLPSDVRQRLTRDVTYLWTVQAVAESNQELDSASHYFEIE